ncbi:protein THEMIS [Rhineura floridana]|uniref:protein THEMIS n=1 Tax=Rhineura floridana TaxID=261503 RepID=UPI002AC868D7|nr:protein THEMIS [Rhineura floridana]
MASSLKDFIHSMDPNSLPRILQIQSGFYDEVYEKYSHECCLSTGDVIKVVGLKVKKVLASNYESEDTGFCSTTVELPLNFPGLCRIVADKTPYANIEEIVKKVLIGSTQLQHPCFCCSKDVKTENLTIKQGEKIIFSSVENNNGILTIHCGVMRDNQLHAFVLPVSQEGDFYECEDYQIYTLKDIAEWKIPKSRSRSVTFTNTCNAVNSSSLLPIDVDGCVVLTPVYEVQAMMKFQKEKVYFLSDLDVEVKDVTDHYNIHSFLQPLSMEDILKRSCNEFPIVVAVIEGSTGNKQSYTLLHPGREIVIYKKCQATRILASEIKGDAYKKHFLIPTSYKGKFKRRPREFPTAYDLKIARSMKEQLHVIATKAFESPHKGLSSVSIGDQFQIPQCQLSEIVDLGKKEVENALACEQILLQNKTYKSVLLPMCMEGGFVELVHDKKQYELMELCKDFHLPFNVKVSIRDLSIQDDILAGISCLQLEEEIVDLYLLVSTFSNPTEIWEAPVHRLNMSVQLLSKHAEAIVYFPTRSIVEEITEEQYYMMRKYESQATNPPPRPPKTHIAEESKASFLTVPAQSACGLPRPRKDLCVDATKMRLSNKAAAVLGLQFSCQSDLEQPENKEDMAGTATFAEERMIKDSSKSVLVKQRAEKKPKAGPDADDKDDDILESATKKTLESSENEMIQFCQKALYHCPHH